MIINKNAENKKLTTNILALSNQAAKAKREDPMVINATSGMFKDESGVLYEFSCVKKAIESLNINQKFSYSKIEGSPRYNEAVLYSLFGKYLDDIKKDCYLDVVATPGGTGALHLAIANYAEINETILVPNHMWENYLSLANELRVNADTYSLFNDQSHFDIASLNEKISSLNNQKRILILVNDPCENPTGFCMQESDYDDLLLLAKKHPEHDFIFLMDVAYFDYYSTDPNIIRSRYAKFKNMPSNALTLFVFSGSKSFGLYGLRIGALVGLSNNKQEIEAFKNASVVTARGTWSSSSMLGASIIEELVLNEQYRLSYEEEIKYVCSMLEARSLAFLEEAKKVGLATLPYERGFFICVPCSQPKEMAAQLQNDKVHLVPTKECLRIALCSVSKEEATRLPKIIKNRLDSIEK